MSTREEALTARIFDSAISRALEESDQDAEKESEGSPESDVHRTRLYDVVMATAMCMIIGEWQKRMTFGSLCCWSLKRARERTLALRCDEM
ncbi:hypothetical protein N7492_001425 [Penicillium capsulatum]|uniref:Uncharacterized protein n=1 Tax=Penicillium capsulatum TaxID=69766 RepID=A0A9W9IRK8_9EURO|nr:hypothetical protein N7492_001425 [Penicillium capsulatum]KAJ6129518.1 hypothetical protein N7512_002298 [Penicillium capsulatum]